MSSETVPPGGTTAQAARSPRELAEATRRELEAAFNRGDFTLVRDITAPDAITRDPTMPRAFQSMRGPEAFVQLVSKYRAAFPDLQFTVEDTIAEDDKVAVRWRAEGTHRGELMGLAPTGVHATATGMSMNRWQNGKVVEAWVEWDNLGLARQIGAAPPEGSVGERVATLAQRVIALSLRRRAGA